MVWTCEKDRGGALGKMWEVRVGGQRLVGWPRKKSSECMMEDLNLLGVEKHVAQDRHMWKAVLDGEIRTLNENDIILNNFNIGKL